MSTDGRLAPVVRLLLVSALAFGLSSCGDDPEPAPLDLSDGKTSTAGDPSDPSSSPAGNAGTPAPTLPPGQGAKVESDDVHVWTLKLPTGQPERSAGQALVDYIDVRIGSYHAVSVNLPELAAVAFGEPLTDVQAYVGELRDRGHHTVGDVWIKVAPGDVRVQGKRARLTDVCIRNGTVDVNRKGVAVESPPAAYATDAVAQRVAADAWVITEISLEPVPDC